MNNTSNIITIMIASSLFLFMLMTVTNAEAIIANNNNNYEQILSSSSMIKTNSRRRRRRTTTTNVIHPGDLIEGGFRHDEQPQWWHDIKDGMENHHLLRKCEFLDHIPNSGDECSGVATHSDHYFCIFGDEQKPSWFCTCYEHIGDYKFHCNSNQISTVEEIIQDEPKTISSENDNIFQEEEEQEKNSSNAIVDAIQHIVLFEENTATNNNKEDEIVHPGDLIDKAGGYRHEESQWWHDMKNDMMNQHLLRKCDFLERIPNTGDRCPGVATHSDHYFCIFGTSVRPSWYCTCYEHIGDYTFHCNSNTIITVDEISAFSNNNENDNSKYILDDLPSEQQLLPEEQNNSVEEISAGLTKSTRDGNKNDENLTKTIAVDDSSASGSEQQQEQEEEEQEEEQENKGEIRKNNKIIITEAEQDVKELGMVVDDSSASGSEQQQQEEENKGGIRKNKKSIATKVEDDAKELGFGVTAGIGLFIGIVIISNVIFAIAQ